MMTSTIALVAAHRSSRQITYKTIWMDVQGSSSAVVRGRVAGDGVAGKG